MAFQVPYNSAQMSESKPIDQIAERVERLLLRHEELQRTTALLQAQVQELQLERDMLRSRIGTARARIDELIARLPDDDNALASTKEIE